MRALNTSRKVILALVLAAILVTGVVLILTRLGAAQRDDLVTFAQYLGAGLGGVLLVAAIVVIWNRSPGRQVRRRTVELSRELAEHRQAEEALQKAYDELETRVTEQAAEFAKVNEALRKERDFAETLLDTAQVIILVLDVEGRIVRFNLYMEEISGYSLAEVQGKDWFSTFLPVKDHAKIRALFREAVSDIQTRGNVNPIVRKDGSEREIEWYDKTLKDADGNTVGVLAIGMDITERKRAEEGQRQALADALQATHALRESEERFHKIIENTQAGYFYADRDGKFQHVNDAWMQMHGYTARDEVIGQHFAQVEADMEEAQRNVERLLGGDPIPSGEFTRRCKDGSIGYHTFSAVPVVCGGEVVGMEGFIIDTTERKRVEETLRESKERYRVLAESSPNGIFISDVERIIYVNQRLCEITGFSEDELLNMPNPVGTLFAPNEQERVLGYAQGRIVGDAVPNSYHVRGVRKDGTEILLKLAVSSSVLSGRRVLQGTVEDITERKRAEDALRESEEKHRTLFETMAQGIIYQDAEGEVISANPAAGRLFGLSMGQMRDLTPLDPRWHVIHQDGSEFLRETSPSTVALRTGKEVKDVVMGIFNPQTDEYRWLNVHAVPQIRPGEDTPYQVYTIFDDITERKRADEALRQRNRELATLNRASQALVSILDLDQVLVSVLEEMRSLLNVTAASTWLIDPKTDELVCQQVTGPQNEIVRGWRMVPGQGLGGWVARSGESLIVPDAQADERYFWELDRRTGLKLRSILNIPMRVKDGVIGVFQVVDTEVGRFSETDLELLEPLVMSAAIAIENARLYEQTRQDVETRSVLLREVNHRVKNNLTGILGLLYTARDSIEMDADTVHPRALYLSTMNDLICRVRGLATAHDLLSASRWAPLRLSDLAARIINVSLEALPPDKRVVVNVLPSSVRVTSDQAHNLALVIGELTTNTVKHTLEGRDTAHITFQSTLNDADSQQPLVRCEFRDDGPGYPRDILRWEGCNVGFDLVQNIMRKGLRGELTLHNDGGAVAVIQFAAQVREQ